MGGECLFLGVEVLVFAFSIWMCVCDYAGSDATTSKARW